MSTHPQSPDISLDEIIDGIVDAKTISKKEQENILTQIQREGGITSTRLWDRISNIFEAEAMDAERLLKSEGELLKSLAAEPSAPEGDAEDEIVLEMLELQRGILREYESDIGTNVLGYIERLERDAAKNAEAGHEKGNVETIKKLKQDLQSPPSEL